MEGLSIFKDLRRPLRTLVKLQEHLSKLVSKKAMVS